MLNFLFARGFLFQKKGVIKITKFKTFIPGEDLWRSVQQELPQWSIFKNSDSWFAEIDALFMPDDEPGWVDIKKVSICEDAVLLWGWFMSKNEEIYVHITETENSLNIRETKFVNNFVKKEEIS